MDHYRTVSEYIYYTTCMIEARVCAAIYTCIIIVIYYSAFCNYIYTYYLDA